MERMGRSGCAGLWRRLGPPFTKILTPMHTPVTTVSGDYVQGSFGLLPLAGERARAALYFSRFVGSTSFEGNLELARWYLRAALSEFRSIFDLLNLDLKSMRLASQWKRSTYKAQLDADPLVSILRKVRDFAIHSAHITGVAKNFKVSSPQDPAVATSDMPSIVIDPIDRDAFAAGRSGDELSMFDDETLSFFNQQTKIWPADMLIHVTIYRASQPLAGFLSTTE